METSEMSGAGMASDELQLMEILSQPDTVLYIGSGISTWSGAPTWEDLLIALEGFVVEKGSNVNAAKKMRTSGDFLNAAGFLVDQLNEAELLNFLTVRCNLSSLKPHEIHQIICEIGPRCFITTNFDDLIEQQLSKSYPDRKHQVVTNRKLTEIANVQKARSNDFVFKPHGDLSDASSIVLSKKQYDRLVHGTTPVLKALETLLVTRPILFIGFGLRDPDFVHVQTLLREYYKGAATEHVAILPNIEGDEKEYWRKQLGIRIVSYKTRANKSGSSAHIDLIGLLKKALGQTQKPTMKKSSDFYFNLAKLGARHAKSVGREIDQFPLEVWSSFHEGYVPPITGFEVTTAHEVVRKYPKSFALVGAAGSGKSHILNRFVAQNGTNLRDKCLIEGEKTELEEIAILVDLKRFEGSLDALIAESLPSELSIESICANAPSCFILDGVNEIATRFIDSDEWQNSVLQFMESHSDSRFIFSARDPGMLQTLKIPIFQIIGIQKGYCTNVLNKQLPEKFVESIEYRTFCSNALLMQLAKKYSSELKLLRSPIDFHRLMMRKYLDEVVIDSCSSEEIEFGLCSLGYDLVDEGREVASRTEISQYLRKSGIQNPDQVIQQLVASGLLISHPEDRLSFVHQTMTEYLAANALSDVLETNEGILLEKLRSSRWDYVLLLLIDLLPEVNKEKYIRNLILADSALALRATGFAESNQSNLRISVLLALPEELTFDEEHQLATQIERLKYSPTDMHALEEVSRRDNSVGGAAAAAFIELDATKAAPLFEERMLKGEFSYNYLNHLAPAIGRKIVAAGDKDILRFLSSIEILDIPTIDDTAYGSADGTAIQHAIEEVISQFPVERQLETLRNFRLYEPGVVAALAGGSFRLESRGVIPILFDMIREGHVAAVFPAYLSLRGGVSSEEIPEASTENIGALIEILDKNVADKKWTYGLIRALCLASTEWQKSIRDAATIAPQVQAHALRIVSEKNTKKLGLALKSSFQEFGAEIPEELLRAVANIDFDESGENHDWLIECLTSRNRKLVEMVIESRPQNFSIAPQEICWEILEWMNEVRGETGDTSIGNFHAFGLLSFLGSMSCSAFEIELLDAVKKKEPRSLGPLGITLLSHMKNFTPDLISHELKKTLARYLAIQPWIYFNTQMATEEFIENYLVPLTMVKDISSSKRENLKEILANCGRKFGRRYLPSNPET